MSEGSLNLPEEYTFADWCRVVEMLAGIGRNNPWWNGDAVIGGERFGERASNYWNDLGYKTWASLSNVVRVCETFPPALRHAPGASFSHFQAALRFSREEGVEKAAYRVRKAGRQAWTVKALREDLYGVRERVKRWSLAELREILEETGYTATISFIRHLEKL
jgi:hypothetical protein